MSSAAPDSRDAVGYFSRHGSEYKTNLHAPSFDERFEVFEGWLARIAAGACEAPVCVDLGCGPGTLSLAAAKRGYHVVAVDGSEKMLEIAAREARRKGVTLDLRHLELPLSDESLHELEGNADVVIASSVIEYIDSPPALPQTVPKSATTGRVRPCLVR